MSYDHKPILLSYQFLSNVFLSLIVLSTFYVAACSYFKLILLAKILGVYKFSKHFCLKEIICASLTIGHGRCKDVLRHNNLLAPDKFMTKHPNIKL